MLAPDYHKDQEFTKKAIRTLQDFQYYYPEKDSLYNETDIMIVKLRNTLGQKDYETAQLYKKLESPRSALIYYDSVIKDYDDTDFFEPAWFGKIEMLYMLKRTEEAENAVLMYNKLFPDGKFTSDIKAVATGKYINK
ncbi:Outer membrane protein assembly factor BamD [bioreactor metagenome]|uniref:Outer membrane protein assembly factor BamD n=1 Tax=bioreactor metagenome TaxID=1076179 RepID=A0A645GRR4_9ZZZZ